jgi:hypothetical protein
MGSNSYGSDSPQVCMFSKKCFFCNLLELERK